jgi:putative ABC transport system permease protein
LANIIAWPITYWLMNEWLNEFAYRIAITIWVFLLSGLLAAIIAILTVSAQAWKAARANPIDSIRYE